MSISREALLRTVASPGIREEVIFSNSRESGGEADAVSSHKLPIGFEIKMAAGLFSKAELIEISGYSPDTKILI